jgi:hypothetical protein
MDVRRIPVHMSAEEAMILFLAAIERGDLERADQWAGLFLRGNDSIHEGDGHA